MSAGSEFEQTVMEVEGYEGVRGEAGLNMVWWAQFQRHFLAHVRTRDDPVLFGLFVGDLTIFRV